MGRKVTISACTLNLWAMDFEGNLEKILESISLAKKAGSKLRVGTELEICGYSCQDHFLECDTFLHCWQVLVEIIKHPDSEDMLIFVGMPVMHKNVSYNCLVAIFNKEVVMIKPKQNMANEGNYRESRYFSPWLKTRKIEEFQLPRMIRDVTKQTTAPIGDALISTLDTCIGCEICEDLWVTNSPHDHMALDGVEIFLNANGGHHELRKSAYVSTSLVKHFTSKNGGVYVYANQRGCDGDRLYFDGVSLITVNGDIIAYTKQFALEEIEVITAVVDLEDVRNYRLKMRSSRDMAARSEEYPRIQVDIALSSLDDLHVRPSLPIQIKYNTVEEEIALGPACWLWDILRRSNLGGFFLPLSGGKDSASTACIVYSMCRLLCNSIKNGDENVLNDLRKVVGDSTYAPNDPKELCNRLFVTCYLGTENSSKETKEMAEKLAENIGSHHISCKIDTAVSAVISVFKSLVGFVPKFKSQGGEPRENLALQNLQARLRMVVSYFFAQLLQWSRSKRSSLLVLGSANVDESLTGYLTKYDCSSADVNPIGGLSKRDLKTFLEYCYVEFELPALRKIIDSIPTAELEPLKDGVIVQSDETDMGMTYDELSTIGKLRLPGNCGPYSAFCKLIHTWGDRYTPAQVAHKVQLFFRMYAMNRHKMTVATPCYHAENYSPSDSRYDHRPFLYNIEWPWQFKLIDSKVKALMENKKFLPGKL